MAKFVFEKNERFAGQNQCILLENHDLFHIVIPKNYGGDPWFYLLYY